jgi:hypothetical protein
VPDLSIYLHPGLRDEHICDMLDEVPELTVYKVDQVTELSLCMAQGSEVDRV